MYEYVNVSVSSYDPASLAAKLTERSGDGWEVVAIVPTGGDVTVLAPGQRDGQPRRRRIDGYRGTDGYRRAVG